VEWSGANAHANVDAARVQSAKDVELYGPPAHMSKYTGHKAQEDDKVARGGILADATGNVIATGTDTKTGGGVDETHDWSTEGNTDSKRSSESPLASITPTSHTDTGTGASVLSEYEKHEDLVKLEHLFAKHLISQLEKEKLQLRVAKGERIGIVDVSVCVPVSPCVSVCRGLLFP